MKTKIMAMYKMAQGGNDVWYAVGYAERMRPMTVSSLHQDEGVAIEEMMGLKDVFDKSYDNENREAVENVIIRKISLPNSYLSDLVLRGSIRPVADGYMVDDDTWTRQEVGSNRAPDGSMPFWMGAPQATKVVMPKTNRGDVAPKLPSKHEIPDIMPEDFSGLPPAPEGFSKNYNQGEFNPNNKSQLNDDDDDKNDPANWWQNP